MIDPTFVPAPPRPARPVPIACRARSAYPFMRDVVLAVPGAIVLDEASGIRVQVREDGGLEEIGVPEE